MWYEIKKYTNNKRILVIKGRVKNHESWDFEFSFRDFYEIHTFGFLKGKWDQILVMANVF